MRKVKGIIGQDLISLADGHRIASVKDVVIDDGQERVAALVVKEGGVLSTARAVPMEAVHSFGRDAIVIDGDDSVVDVTALPTDVASDRSLAGMKVFSDAGEEVGTIADVYFEQEGGRIVGFEVSSGMIGDIAAGPRFLPVEQVERIGDDIVYIRPDSAETLAPVPGGSTGAAGAVDDLRTRISEAAHDAGEQLSGAVTKVGTTLEEAGQEERAREATEPPPGTELIGRRSGSDVTDDQGRILVANGQLITVRHVDRARESGQLEALRASADAWDAAERERAISGAVEQIADTAGSAWDRFMRTLSQMSDDTGQRMSDQQSRARLAAINDAVGRPVTKVILDRSDAVILNLGDIITHQAIQRAHEAGILDTLLASVYKGEVQFGREEMRAPAEATSTVDKASGGAGLVEELETSLTSSETQRREESERKRREAEAARAQREAERQERARAREEAAEAARRATADDDEPESVSVPREPGGTSPAGTGRRRATPATRRDTATGASRPKEG